MIGTGAQASGIERFAGGFDKQPARALEIGLGPLGPAQPFEIPLDRLNRVTLSDARTVEYARQPLELAVARGKGAMRAAAASRCFIR